MSSFLSNPEFFAFIAEHAEDDPGLLALRLQKESFSFPISEVLTQIELRKKAVSKFPEWASCPQVYFPSRLAFEQSSSAITANYKSRLISGDQLVDLTGGLGIDSGAFSRTFQKVTYVEKDAALANAAQHNFAALGLSRITCHQADASIFLTSMDFDTDYFYIDPARRRGHQKTYFLEDTEPNILLLQQRLMKRCNGFLLKASPMLEIKSGLAVLQNVKSVHIVAVKNECKEVLFLCEKGAMNVPKVHAVNYAGATAELFEFDYTQENDAILHTTMPKRYLYEPNVAVLKAGAFKTLLQSYPVSKLHANSHLYTSQDAIQEFPGRAFEILGIESARKKSLGPYGFEGHANITVRNFPQNVDKLRKVLNLGDGGEFYVFATTLANDEHKLIICRKLSEQFDRN